MLENQLNISTPSSVSPLENVSRLEPWIYSGFTNHLDRLFLEYHELESASSLRIRPRYSEPLQKLL